MACLLSLICALSTLSNDHAWTNFYDAGFHPAAAVPWTSPTTSSKRIPEGLQISDLSTAKGSGRMYHLDWQVDPRVGATAEARLKVFSCSAPWGVTLLVADGLHEEGVTFFPHQIMLAGAKLSAPFDTIGEFHTYRVHIERNDIQVWADEKLLLDGRGKFTASAHSGRNCLGFGCGSSAATGDAIWQRVRFQGGELKTPIVALPQVQGLDVQIGATQAIVPDATYVNMFKLADGTLVVGNRRSADGGKTWQPGQAFHIGAYQFPDGEIVQLGFHSRKTDREGYFTIPLTRSTDHGLTAKGETAQLHIPDGTGGTGDDGRECAGPVADHAMVRLRDGSLLATMYGQFKSDRVLVPTMPVAWQCFKYRTFVVRSADRGRTWEYLATVAYDPNIGLESFCEADLLTLPDGDILCFMRTGGSGGKHTPLYLGRSSDDGRTWSTPQPIADRGVWPNACRMQTGVLVCTYGRPDNWLAFSFDNGRTWTGHFCFYSGPTTSYNSLEEIAPNVLLVVYDRQLLDADGNMRRETVGTTLTVKRR